MACRRGQLQRLTCGTWTFQPETISPAALTDWRASHGLSPTLYLPHFLTRLDPSSPAECLASTSAGLHPLASACLPIFPRFPSPAPAPLSFHHTVTACCAAMRTQQRLRVAWEAAAAELTRPLPSSLPQPRPHAFGPSSPRPPTCRHLSSDQGRSCPTPSHPHLLPPSIHLCLLSTGRCLS